MKKPATGKTAKTGKPATRGTKAGGTRKNAPARNGTRRRETPAAGRESGDALKTGRAGLTTPSSRQKKPLEKKPGDAPATAGGRRPASGDKPERKTGPAQAPRRAKPASKTAGAKKPLERKKTPRALPQVHKSGEPTKAAARVRKQPAAPVLSRRSPILLNEARRRFLRGQARKLEPVVLIGKGGMSEALLAKAAVELQRHELLKLHFHNLDGKTVREAADQLAEATAAAVVDAIGKTVVLFRENIAIDKATMHAGGLEIDRGVLRRL